MRPSIPAGSFRIHPELGLLVTRFSGDVTGAVILDVYRRAYGDAGYAAGMNEFVDLSSARSIAFTNDDLQRIRDLTARAAGTLQRPVRTAIFAASDLAFGMGRMYEALAEPGPEEVAVFRERAEALGWLGVPDPARADL